MRIDELTYDHPAALYRGDGAGVAPIRRHAPLSAGPGWARVDAPAAGLDAGYVYVVPHAGAVAVFRADAAMPATVDRPDLDPRLTSCGEYFELSDADAARAADTELAARSDAANAAIRAATFTLPARVDGIRTAVEVGPTAFGSTTLVLRDEDGRVRHLKTAAPRGDLERARITAVRVEAVESIPRRLLGGTRARPVSIELGPLESA